MVVDTPVMDYIAGWHTQRAALGVSKDEVVGFQKNRTSNILHDE